MYANASLWVVISRPSRKDEAISRLPCRIKWLRAASPFERTMKFMSVDDCLPTRVIAQ